MWGVVAIGLFADNPYPLDTTSGRKGLFKGLNATMILRIFLVPSHVQCMNSYRRRLVPARNTKLICTLLVGLEFCQLRHTAMGIV